MDIEYIPLSDIIPYDNNPRNNDESFKYVAESIKQFGFKVPIIVDSNNIIIAGHTRLRAAELLGLKEAPCIRAGDLTDEQIKAFRLADNKVAEFSTWDLDKLDIELGEICDINMNGFGFDEFKINEEDFSTDFELPEGDKNEICQMTFTLHEKQKELIEYAVKLVGEDVTETFGNTNKNGNGLYEVVRQWAEQKK